MAIPSFSINKKEEAFSPPSLLNLNKKMNEFIKNYFTALFSKFPALNFATLAAGILISFPVCGFLPILALLFATEKVPNPVRGQSHIPLL